MLFSITTLKSNNPKIYGHFNKPGSITKKSSRTITCFTNIKPLDEVKFKIKRSRKTHTIQLAITINQK
jgi:hypothetical protein